MEAISHAEQPESGQVVVEDVLVDPVAYLRSLGIETELVTVLPAPVAPAA